MGMLMSEHQSQHVQPSKKIEKSASQQIISFQSPLNLSQVQTPDSILHLQRTIGNFAVQQLMNSAPSTSKPKIQRKEIGLEQSQLSDDFVSKGYTYWSNPANKDKSVTDYASHLTALVNEQLATFGVHPVNHDFRTTGSVGAFRRSEWMIYFNSDVLKEKGETVGELTQKEAGEIANTVYHEARHGEQTFRVARMLAGEKKPAEDIASELPIPAEVAEKAHLSPLKNTDDTAEEFSEAKDWYNLLDGIHEEYASKIMDYRAKAYATFNVMDELTADNFEESKQKVSDFMTEAKDPVAPWLINEKKRVEAIENPTDADKSILKHLEEIFDKTIVAIARWDDGKVAKDLAGLTTMKDPIMNLWIAAFRAYEDFADEKDAWAVGDKVGKDFENKQPEPAK